MDMDNTLRELKGIKLALANVAGELKEIRKDLDDLIKIEKMKVGIFPNVEVGEVCNMIHSLSEKESLSNNPEEHGWCQDAE